MNNQDEFYQELQTLQENFLNQVATIFEKADLSQFDYEIRTLMGGTVRGMLVKIFEKKGSKKSFGPEVGCPCGAKALFKQHRPFTFHTILPGGEITCKRLAYYVCPRCNRGQTPLLKAMNIGQDGDTPHFKALCALASVSEPYQEAASNLLSRMAGVEVDARELQRMVVEKGQEVEAFLQKETQGESTPRPPTTKKKFLYVQTDGGMVHVDGGWTESKLGIIFRPEDMLKRGKRPEILMKRVVGTLEGVDVLKKLLWTQFMNAGGEKRIPVVMGDGAAWIWNMASDIFPERVEILDFYHATEHLSDCGKVLFGEGSKELESWFLEQKKRLKAGGVLEVIESLTFLKRRFTNPDQIDAIGGLNTYFENNKNRMKYLEYRRMGLQIGSGPIESAVKGVMQNRMKRPGMRWRRKGAKAMLALRCIYKSTEMWDSFWSRQGLERAV